MGFARLAEGSIRNARGIPAGERLSTLDRVAASALGGALGCWNQPIEVVRVEVRLDSRCWRYLLIADIVIPSSYRCNQWLNPLDPPTDLSSPQSETLSPTSTKRTELKDCTVVSPLVSDSESGKRSAWFRSPMSSRNGWRTRLLSRSRGIPFFSTSLSVAQKGVQLDPLGYAFSLSYLQ